MFTKHSKIVRISCVAIVVICAVFLLLNIFGGEKYRFIDDGVLQAPDGTIYRRYEKAVYFCCEITFGEYLGKVRGYIGKSDDGYRKGVYSLNSDGSDDYIVFVEEDDVDYYESGEPQRGTWPIYVKDGCELSFRNWDKVIELGFEPFDLELPEYFIYPLKKECNASEVMNLLVGDEFTDIHDRSMSRGYFHYRIEGIDLIAIKSYAEHNEKAGWILYSTDFKQYKLNPEAFRMFDMPEETADYLQYPFSEERWLEYEQW